MAKKTMASLVRGGLGVGDRKRQTDNGEDDAVQQALLLRKQQHLRIQKNTHGNHHHHQQRHPKQSQQNQPKSTTSIDGSGAMYEEGGTNHQQQQQQHHGVGVGPMVELPIYTIPYFLGAAIVIAVTAIFMHLIATSHAETRRQQQIIYNSKATAKARMRKQRQQQQRYNSSKLKTDEYNEDADIDDDEELLLTASVRGTGSHSKNNNNKTKPATTIYYPYHQPPPAPAVPHHWEPTTILALPQPPSPPQPSQQHHRPRYRGGESSQQHHLHHSLATAPISSSNTTTNTVTGATATMAVAAATPPPATTSRNSYYLNPSGYPVILPNNYLPSTSTTTSSSSPPTSSTHSRYRPSSPTIPANKNNKNRTTTATNSAHHDPTATTTPERMFPQPGLTAERSILHARQLSTTASSFASLIRAASQEDYDEDEDGDDLGLHVQTPCSSFREYHDSDPYDDDIEATPRIVNSVNDAIDQGLASLGSAAATNTTTTTTRLVPFVPSLDRVEPPKSVNLDDIRRFPTHFYHQFDASGDQFHHEILAATIPSSDDEPLGDGRNHGIQHIRPDVTEDTNSSESLQLAIDFNEIKLSEVIGGGGFGQVYRAVWKGTPVAVKILTGSAQSKGVPRGVLQEFAAELNLLRGMRHPNVCLLMGACLEPPHRAIVTELAAYGSLWDALRLPLHPPYDPCDGITRDGWPDGLYRPDARHGVPPTLLPSVGSTLTAKRFKLPPPSVPHVGAWRWTLVHKVACGAARGMAYLHGGKPPILHRDLKSANILLDESYTAKVCDFGLSRIKSTGQSMTGNCGTVQWMAPEVLANQDYNEKADIYSFGIIFWELLSQQCPYDKMTPIQCALAVLNRNQRPEIPKWCPPPLQALIRSCLKKDPEERPTFEQIIAALDTMPLI